MQHFKNHNARGFSFIEVILTIALIGAVVTPAFMVQYNVLNFLIRSSDTVRALFLLDALFPQAFLQEKKDQGGAAVSFEKKYEDPAVSAKYVVTDLPEKSSLKKLTHLYIARSKGTWERAGVKEVQEEISFVFRAPKEEEKEGEEKESKKEKKGTQEKTAAGQKR